MQKFSMAFSSSPAPPLPSFLAHIFMANNLTWSWARTELATRAHYVYVGFIKKNSASLAKHFNVTKSRQQHVCLSLPPCPLPPLVFTFASTRVSFTANCHCFRFWGRKKRGKSICWQPCRIASRLAWLLCPLWGSSVVHKFQIHFYVLLGRVPVGVQTVPLERILLLATMSLWHESSLELIATSQRHRHPETTRAKRKNEENRI